MATGQAINQTTLAQQLGVSQRAVSFALNNRPGVSPETRQRILAAADRLGYRVNAAARATRTQRFGQVALVQSTDPRWSYQPPRMLDVVHDALAERRLHLVYTKLSDTHLTDKNYTPGILNELRVDGLLVNLRHRVPPAMARLIDGYAIPAVFMGAEHDHDVVSPDDAWAARELARRLIELGHRRIVLLDLLGPSDPDGELRPAQRRRHLGYREAMEAAGLKPLIVCRCIDPSDRVAYVTRLLQAPDRPTALIVETPDYIYDVVDAATHNARLRVPQDLSICGFNHEPTRVRGIQIATMVSPHDQVGREAVDMLTRKIAEPTAPIEPVALKHAFVKGLSLWTAPEPGGSGADVHL